MKYFVTALAITITILLSLSIVTKEGPKQEIERVVETKVEYVEIPKVKLVVDTKTINNNEPMEMTVTGYTAGPESTGKSPGDSGYGITFTGTKVKEPTAATPGTCAVDPNVIELGTTLYVEGYGLCKAEDTGSAVNGYHVDVYLETVEKVYRQIGKGKRNVWILDSWGGS